MYPWNFPGGPVVKNLSFQCKGLQVQSQLGALRSRMLRGIVKKKKKGKKVKKEKKCNQSYQRVKMKREVFRMKDRGYQNMLF